VKTVHKFPLNEFGDGGVTELVIDPNAEFIRGALDPNGVPCVWAIVDTEAPKKVVKLRVFGTGHKLPEDCFYYGTFQAGMFVWHLFRIYD